MSQVELLLCRDFRETVWELPAVRPRLLIAWRESPEAVDAGVPHSVSTVVATALLHMGRTAWFSDQPVPGTQTVARLTAQGGIGRRAISAHLVSSDDPKLTARLFDATGFIWTLRSQAGFAGVDTADLSDPATFLAAVGARDVDALIPVLASGVAGILVPGVDGDVAGFYAPGPDGIDRFVQGLKQAPAGQSAPLTEVSEAQLKAML